MQVQDGIRECRLDLSVLAVICENADAAVDALAKLTEGPASAPAASEFLHNWLAAEAGTQRQLVEDIMGSDDTSIRCPL